MNATRAAQRVGVTVGDTEVVSHVGAHLLAEIADRSGLSSGYSGAVPQAGERAPGQDRGRVLTHVAVAIADGSRSVAGVAALGDQPALFGEVASAPTIWRALSAVDEDVLAGLRQARAVARERIWAAGDAPERVTLDVDATLVEVHSEAKEGAAAHFKGGFGFHPMVCSLDQTGEVLAARLRPGNAAANSAADQLGVVDDAIASLPEAWRAGHRPGDDPAEVAHGVLMRADTAGAVYAFVDGVVARNCEFSVGARVTDALDSAIAAVPDAAWRPARAAGGGVRRGAWVSELDVDLNRWPDRTRAICRRERPHPGAQLRLWDHNGWRHQVTLTNSSGDPVALEARHRGHARVENRIKALKDCAADRTPFASFAANAAWLELCLAACDLIAWCQWRCLDGALARAEPRTLRYRLLHVAGRLVRSGRRTWVRLSAGWPWADALAAAYQRAVFIGP